MRMRLDRRRGSGIGFCIAALLAWGCAVDLGIEKKDGWTDAEDPPFDDVTDDPPIDDVTDDPGAEEIPDLCGNGEIDDGEECDCDPDRSCTTECGSEGTERCVGCSWSECFPPVEICNGDDDDCDDRTDESGEVTVAAGPVAVSNDPARSANPSIAWTGSAFGIVWEDGRGSTTDAWSAVLAPDGTIDPAEDLLRAAVTAVRHPSVVWGAGVFGFVISDGDAGAEDIVFARMDEHADYLGPPRPVADLGATPCLRPDLVTRPGGYAAVWDSFFNVHFVLMNGMGNPQGPVVDLDDDGNVSRDAALASSGDGFGVAWVDERDARPGIYAAVLGASGGIVEAFRLSDARASSDGPAIVWDGSTYAVVWSDSCAGLLLGRFNSTGTVIGTAIEVADLGSGASEPSLAWTGSTFGLAWVGGTGDSRQMLFRALESSGTPLTIGIPVGEAGEVGSPDLAWTGTSLGLAWHDEGIGAGEIEAAVLFHGECP